MHMNRKMTVGPIQKLIFLVAMLLIYTLLYFDVKTFKKLTPNNISLHQMPTKIGEHIQHAGKYCSQRDKVLSFRKGTFRVLRN